MITVRKLSDQVHDLLLRQILEGWRAPGSSLREVDLAEDLDVSRTPIREAISRLRAEGFVEARPNRAATVRLLDGAQVRQIFQVREALETWAVARACTRMDEADLEHLRAVTAGIAEAGTEAPRELWQLDRQFHTTIAERTGSPLLTEEIERYIDLAGLVGSCARYEEGDAEAAKSQHRRVLSALRAREPEAAREAMADHVHSAGELIVQRMPAADE